MGAFLDKPKTEKYNESQSGAGLRYGLSSMQGWRIEMEDAHSALIGIPDIGDKVCWFAVFDGHAGSRVSAHCAKHLLDCIVTNDDLKRALKSEGTMSQVSAHFLPCEEKVNSHEIGRVHSFCINILYYITFIFILF
jgi:protein phosphatase 1B